jgi:CelD/BcsL family acetyltransferase involved in cellulose biosynthesis
VASSCGATDGPADVLVTERLAEYSAAWDRLVDIAPLPSPFLRSWWLEEMARGRAARYVLVTRDGELIGGLALEERRRFGLPVLRELGAGPLCPDHIDLVAAEGQGEVVATALRAWLHRRGPRLIDLTGVVEGHRLGSALGTGVSVTEEEAAPWVPLPAGFDQFQDSLPRSLRTSIRRSTAKLGRQGHVDFRVVPGDRFEDSLTRLRVLHAGQFGPDSGLIVEFERFASAARAGAAVGECQLFELWVGDEVAAVDVVFTVGRRMSYYQGGRSLDDRFGGAGTVLMSGGFSWACEHGFQEVDFLRGTEPYKMQWADRRRRLQRLRVGVGVAGRATLGAVTLRESAATRAVGRRAGTVLRAARAVAAQRRIPKQRGVPKP